MIADRYGRKWSIVPSNLVAAVSLFMLAGAFVHAVGSSLAGPRELPTPPTLPPPTCEA